MGKLYEIGVRPGSSELLTLKAHCILNAAGVILCPEKEAGAGSFAFDIIQGLLKDTKVGVADLVYPTHYRSTQLREMWKQNAGRITQYLNGDRTGASIMPGDPAVHSTLMYISPYIEETGMEVEVVPSVTSFCIVTDPIKIPLVTWNEDPVVAPVHKSSNEDLGGMLRGHDNVVPMKPSTNPQALLKTLKGNHLENRFVLATKAGAGEERPVTNSEGLEWYDIPYFSTVIIKKQGRQ